MSLKFAGIGKLWSTFDLCNKAESQQKQDLTKRFSGRLTISILRQRIEFYINNEYPIKPFNRLKEHPQSVLSSILFGRIIGGDGAFKTVLNELFIE